MSGQIILRSRSFLFIVSACGLADALQTAKIGSLVDIQDSEDPEGLRVFYYLVQDLKVRLPALATVRLLKPAVPDLFPHLASFQDQAYLENGRVLVDEERRRNANV